MPSDQHVDRAASINLVTASRRAFSDPIVDVLRVDDRDSTLTYEFRLSVTHSGTYGPYEATGERFTVRVTEDLRIVDGYVAGARSTVHKPTLQQQLRARTSRRARRNAKPERLDELSRVAMPLIRSGAKSALKVAASLLHDDEVPLKLMTGALEGSATRRRVLLVVTDQRVLIVARTKGATTRSLAYVDLEVEGERTGLIGSVAQWVPGVAFVGAATPSIRLSSRGETVVVRHLEPAREVMAMMRLIEDNLRRHRGERSEHMHRPPSDTAMGAFRSSMGAISTATQRVRERLEEDSAAPSEIGSSKRSDRASVDASYSRLEALKQLGALRDQGVLTEDEFRREKQRILGAQADEAP